ncbi:MAG: DOMON-like domain-containing protein [Sphingopyxis sp.]
MRATLRPHADCARAGAVRLDVDLAWAAPGLVHLRYVLAGADGALVVPPFDRAERTDGLWRTTCFELFIRPVPAMAPARGHGVSGPYWEVNLAPSTRWAAYHFDEYRAGMADEARLPAPSIAVTHMGQDFALSAMVDVRGIAPLADARCWHIGLSAVLDLGDGNRAYWALNHADGPPDFHHGDCFAGQLAAPEDL